MTSKNAQVVFKEGIGVSNDVTFHKIVAISPSDEDLVYIKLSMSGYLEKSKPTNSIALSKVKAIEFANDLLSILTMQ